MRYDSRSKSGSFGTAPQMQQLNSIETYQDIGNSIETYQEIGNSIETYQEVKQAIPVLTHEALGHNNILKTQSFGTIAEAKYVDTDNVIGRIEPHKKIDDVTILDYDDKGSISVSDKTGFLNYFSFYVIAESDEELTAVTKIELNTKIMKATGLDPDNTKFTIPNVPITIPYKITKTHLKEDSGDDEATVPLYRFMAGPIIIPIYSEGTEFVPFNSEYREFEGETPWNPTLINGVSYINSNILTINGNIDARSSLARKACDLIPEDTYHHEGSHDQLKNIYGVQLHMTNMGSGWLGFAVKISYCYTSDSASPVWHDSYHYYESGAFPDMSTYTDGDSWHKFTITIRKYSGTGNRTSWSSYVDSGTTITTCHQRHYHDPLGELQATINRFAVSTETDCVFIVSGRIGWFRSWGVDPEMEYYWEGDEIVYGNYYRLSAERVLIEPLETIKEDNNNSTKLITNKPTIECASEGDWEIPTLMFAHYEDKPNTISFEIDVNTASEGIMYTGDKDFIKNGIGYGKIVSIKNTAYHPDTPAVDQDLVATKIAPTKYFVEDKRFTTLDVSTNITTAAKKIIRIQDDLYLCYFPHPYSETPLNCLGLYDNNTDKLYYPENILDENLWSYNIPVIEDLNIVEDNTNSLCVTFLFDGKPTYLSFKSLRTSNGSVFISDNETYKDNKVLSIYPLKDVKDNSVLTRSFGNVIGDKINSDLVFAKTFSFIGCDKNIVVQNNNSYQVTLAGGDPLVVFSNKLLQSGYAVLKDLDDFVLNTYTIPYMLPVPVVSYTNFNASRLEGEDAISSNLHNDPSSGDSALDFFSDFKILMGYNWSAGFNGGIKIDVLSGSVSYGIPHMSNLILSPSVDKDTRQYSILPIKAKDVFNIDDIDLLKQNGENFYSAGGMGYLSVDKGLHRSSAFRFIPSSANPIVDQKYDDIKSGHDIIILSNRDKVVYQVDFKTGMLNTIGSIQSKPISNITKVGYEYTFVCKDGIYTIGQYGVQKVYSFTPVLSDDAYASIVVVSDSKFVYVITNNSSTSYYEMNTLGHIIELESLVDEDYEPVMKYMRDTTNFIMKNPTGDVIDIIFSEDKSDMNITSRPIDLISPRGQTFNIDNVAVYTKGAGSITLTIGDVSKTVSTTATGLDVLSFSMNIKDAKYITYNLVSTGDIAVDSIKLIGRYTSAVI